MEKSITVSIRNINESDFFKNWNLDYKPEVYVQLDEIILTVANDQEAVVDQIARVAEENNLSYYVFYQAYDFVQADFDNAPVLEMGYGSFDNGIKVVNGDPIIRAHCKTCGSIKTGLENSVTEIVFDTKHKLKGLIESSEEGYTLFHKTVIDEIQKSKFINGLELMPCVVNGKDGVEKNYSWLYSKVNVGDPSGSIVYESCKDCGEKIVRHRRDFVTHYDKSLWGESDFATSNFSGVLLVSQRIYQLLKEKLPAQEFKKLSFVPCTLS